MLQIVPLLARATIRLAVRALFFPRLTKLRLFQTWRCLQEYGLIANPDLSRRVATAELCAVRTSEDSRRDGGATRLIPGALLRWRRRCRGRGQWLDPYGGDAMAVHFLDDETAALIIEGFAARGQLLQA